MFWDPEASPGSVLKVCDRGTRTSGSSTGSTAPLIWQVLFREWASPHLDSGACTAVHLWFPLFHEEVQPGLTCLSPSLPRKEGGTRSNVWKLGCRKHGSRRNRAGTPWRHWVSGPDSPSWRCPTNPPEPAPSQRPQAQGRPNCLSHPCASSCSPTPKCYHRGLLVSHCKKIRTSHATL